MQIYIYGRIEIKGDFDTYFIEERGNKFFITSLNGYDGGHRSLIAAIKHMQTLVKNEYKDRCMERPLK